MTTKAPAVDYAKLFDLTGRVGIVTGGAGILGAAFIPGLTSQGAKVVLADVNRKSADALVAALPVALKRNVACVETDVSDARSVGRMVDFTLKTFGGVDFLLNNAATPPKDPKEFFAPFEEYSLEEWRRVNSVNLDGVFLVAQAVGRQMVKQGRGGSIIQTASIYGVMASDKRIYEGSTSSGCAINNPAIYAVGKSGVVGLTRWLAAYWAGKNIRVNAIAPGGVFAHENETFVKKYSARVPMGRMAWAHEMVGAAVFLASDASTYVTGQCLMVDGGLSAW